MEQTEGFVIDPSKGKVCKIIKSLYGLKEALRALYTKIDEHLLKHRFNKSLYDPNLYLL